jgi:hypothetical protein
MATDGVTLPQLTAFRRLIDLLTESKDIPILAPIIQREIFYRLLMSDQGARLPQMASAGSQSHLERQSWISFDFLIMIKLVMVYG